MIRITNLKLKLDDAVTHQDEVANLKKSVFSKYKLKPNQLIGFSIFKKATDARRKDNVHFVYTVDLKIKNEETFLLKGIKNVSKTPNLDYQEVMSGTDTLQERPVIIGFGPSGIFAALLLARRGYNPIVLERGYDVDKRTKEWKEFTNSRVFTENASVLYGEGGAGTFSDGKLTTSTSNMRCRFVLEEFIKAGAQKEILYINKPHIGTDILKRVIKNIRNEIISLGGDIRFASKVTDFEIENNSIKAVIVNEQQRIPTNICLLGIGHSARDTFHVLFKKGLTMEQKPFSVGVRIEHKQEMINKSQYGNAHNHPALGAAEYKLSYHSNSGRSAYTFCMCPGGFVVNAASEEGAVVTNGMSYSKRDGENANAALLVNVTPEDFKGDHPLAGITYQKEFEKRAYQLAGNNYDTPLQLVGDFFNDQNTVQLGNVTPTIRPGYKFVRIQDIYPTYITNTMKEALLYFDRRIKGFASNDAVLTGPETRSSSPVRIIRNKEYQSNIRGIYPMGEGPGYAGGIMTAAVDGIKVAEGIIQSYKSLQKK